MTDTERCKNCSNLITAYDLGYRGADVWDYYYCGAISDRDFMLKHSFCNKNQTAPLWCPMRGQLTDQTKQQKIKLIN